MSRDYISDPAEDAAFSLRSIADSLAALAERDHTELDAAWAEAEAALPEGWFLHLAKIGDDCSAHAQGNQRIGRKGRGPTPAAALRALAVKLRDHG